MATFTTERLKELVGYAVKGAGFNKLLELSNLIGIKVERGNLYLNTTDGTNYVRVSDACTADDIDVVVNAELFAKLIGKINSDTVDMTVVDTTLVVQGNGKYTLELVPDENGDLLSFPNKFPDTADTIGSITASEIGAIATTVRTSLSSVVGSLYSNYYFGDIVASTDKAMMSAYNRKIFDEPYLINKEVIDIMVCSMAEVEVLRADNLLVFESHLSEKCSIEVCTPVQGNATEFNVAGINKYVALEVKSFCRFRKAEMIELLDRLALFVSKFDDGAIELTFTDKYVEVSSMASNGIERVEYTESKNAENLTIKINIDRLRNQLKAYGSDIVDLYYGNDMCIKLVDGDMTQLIALIR